MNQLKNIYRQMASNRTLRLSVVAWSVCGLLLFLLFCMFGNTQEPERLGSSVIGWLISQWCDPGSESGHGFFVPLVSAYLVWRNRKSLKFEIATGHVKWSGIWIVSIALVLYWAGVRAQQPRLGVISLILLSWSIPYLLYGWGLARKLVFICGYLALAIPMSFLSSITLPLRLIASHGAVFIVQGLGVGVVCRGTAIISSEPGRFALDVAAACSGLRSLVSLCAVIAAYAYIMHRASWRRWLLFMCAVPIAIVGNIARIIGLVFVAIIFGSEKAIEVAHDYSGYFVFIVSVLLMIVISRQLEQGDVDETLS
jgi:exosortase